MKVLIVGNGGREHALGHAIAKNKDTSLFFAKGNAGTALLGKNIPIASDDIEGLLKFALEEKIDFTVVGPEDTLCLGIVDLFESNGLAIFGPTKAAANLEGSKLYAKTFMEKYNIPTAKYMEACDMESAVKFALELFRESGKVVLKADGLCQGKGVFIASSEEEIEDFCKAVFETKRFGETKLLVEEFLSGFEMSFLCFVDNNTILPLPTAKDHKKVFDGERGLNTGGMGTYSPNIQADVYYDEIMKLVAYPFLEGVKAEGLDFRGIIFIGLMIGKSGIKVLEFNTRFGDPETQSVLQKLDNDLLDVLQKTAEGKLADVNLVFNDKKVITVVASSGGYPEGYKSGYAIEGLENVKDSIVFHAGTAVADGKIVTSGGRVLAVTAAADTFEEAFDKAYGDMKKISFEGIHYRKDISPLVKRVYVCKKPAFDIASQSIRKEILEVCGMDIPELKVYLRYDIENISDDELIKISNSILSESPVDELFMFDNALELQKRLGEHIVVEYHKGQFDKREQGFLDAVTVKLEKSDVICKCATVYALPDISWEQRLQIQKLLINPVDQAEGELLNIPTTLNDEFSANHSEMHVEGFIKFSPEELKAFHSDGGYAMSYEDMRFTQDYFVSEGRNPSGTELAVLDTYWSDHCRHTTFLTALSNVSFEHSEQEIDKTIRRTYEEYLKLRETLGVKKPISLMDLATIVAKKLRAEGMLDDLEISEEVNACSYRIDVMVDGKPEKYLLMFKNETHNHPTEIEPYGGASTCIGGAIRDPLSGRAYVYQAMRVTGSADPREKNTLSGKLPQRKITKEAALGYSSYGNQIGLATGLVDELYHPGYKAKRMEVGAVIAAAPEKNVIRGIPQVSDAIILIGGRTGRDGVGGATGSSKEHTVKSIEVCSVEVQKGNAPMERKLQRLFRNEKVAQMIVRCNDFGAGGVSVAIGELADSLEVNLEKVPLKYKGLTPREIAISESQERMAVVVRKEDVERFIGLCEEENLEATHVADVTDSGRLIIKYKGEVIVNLSREFINSAGAPRSQDVRISHTNDISLGVNMGIDNLEERLSDINVTSKKNLIEMFDSSIGRGTVLLPLGGKNQITPSGAMCAKIPVLNAETTTVSLMSYGANPYLLEQNPFLGAYYAVIESVCKLAATGADTGKAKLSFQEYFLKLGSDEAKWSIPFIALLGAFKATTELNLAPIGGKDSMSGTFENLNVPPTLISFAVTTSEADRIITPELKGGRKLGILRTNLCDDKTLDITAFKRNLTTLLENNANISACYAITHKGLLPMLMEMSFGNDIGFDINIPEEWMYESAYGSFILEYDGDMGDVEGMSPIGVSLEDDSRTVNGKRIGDCKQAYTSALNSIFTPEVRTESDEITSGKVERYAHSIKLSLKPKVVIPVFPGTNCEWDTQRAFEIAGAKTELIVFNNMSISGIEQSIAALAESISEAQILALPGGFSLGDEPDGSGKFIANIIMNPRISDAIQTLLTKNDGLIIGICNGFQALIKTGLLPSGIIAEPSANAPTLTFNNNGRHISRLAKTKAMTTNSPWLADLDTSDEYYVPISHGEGRIVCSDSCYENLVQNDQIAFRYMDNPNGSHGDIEGLISPCGKILGKMGHSERVSSNLYKNFPSISPQPIFRSGVKYFI